MAFFHLIARRFSGSGKDRHTDKTGRNIMVTKSLTDIVSKGRDYVHGSSAYDMQRSYLNESVKLNE